VRIAETQAPQLVSDRIESLNLLRKTLELEQAPMSSASEVDIETIGDVKLRQEKAAYARIQGNNKYSCENSCRQPSWYQSKFGKA